MPVYLVSAGPDVDLQRGFPSAHALGPGLALVESGQTQSQVYHTVKRRLPEGAALFVARLDHQPKFKGVAPGALAWVRERFDGMTA